MLPWITGERKKKKKKKKHGQKFVPREQSESLLK